VLERRTKHGLHLTAAERAEFARWWSEAAGQDIAKALAANGSGV
jgi:hypothetical protein